MSVKPLSSTQLDKEHHKRNSQSHQKKYPKKGQNPELTGYNVSPTEKQPSLFETMLDKEIQLLSKTESLKP